ncbi:MAG: hypothetical protein R3F11_29255 [Verrucomicrobiales bacterium]
MKPHYLAATLLSLAAASSALSASSAIGPYPGLYERIISGNADDTTTSAFTYSTTAPTNAAYFYDLGINGDPSGNLQSTWRGGNLQNTFPWAGNTTLVYTGQFWDADGVFAFAENVDDRTRVTVDGTLVLNDGTWNTAVSTGSLSMGMGPDGDGWHDLEIRFSNGAGTAGASGQNTPAGAANWSPTLGFVFSSDPASITNFLDASQYDATPPPFRLQVPEPSRIVFAMIGLGAVLARRRR